jgi:hypothetical protein
VISNLICKVQTKTLKLFKSDSNTKSITSMRSVVYALEKLKNSDVAQATKLPGEEVQIKKQALNRRMAMTDFILVLK